MKPHWPVSKHNYLCIKKLPDTAPFWLAKHVFVGHVIVVRYGGRNKDYFTTLTKEAVPCFLSPSFLEEYFKKL